MLRGVEYRVIPNGIDLNAFHPGDLATARTKLGLSPTAKIILFAANGTRSSIWRDFPTMEAAVRQVINTNPNVELLFLCLGEDAPEQSIGKARMVFIPFQRDVKQVALYYQASDIYFHAAKAEAFGKTITEALACGLPVVATAVGGIPEQIVDGETGFLTPPGDSQTMALRIEQLLNDVTLRRSMGERGAADAHRRFDLNRQVDDYLTWYNEIIEQKQCAAQP